MFQCLMTITITKNNYQGSFIDWGFIREAFYAKLTSISGEGKPVFIFGIVLVVILFLFLIHINIHTDETLFSGMLRSSHQYQYQYIL